MRGGAVTGRQRIALTARLRDLHAELVQHRVPEHAEREDRGTARDRTDEQRTGRRQAGTPRLCEPAWRWRERAILGHLCPTMLTCPG